MSTSRPSSVLITGAQGFIGRAVAALLRRTGQRLLLLDQEVDASSEESSVRRVTCDISNVDGLRRVFESEWIDAIVHLAAILPTAAGKDPVHATQVNVVGSLNILEMAREFDVRRVVFGSSLSIYGTYPAEQIVSETSRCAPEDVYGAAKLYVEQLGNTYAERYGTEFVSLRIGRVIGGGARSTTSAWRSEIFEFLRESHPVKIRIPYVGTERILLVHVEDVAKSLAALLDAPVLENSVYNAPCESVVVGDLKQELESLNPNIQVMLGNADVTCNPRYVDWSRFQGEFGFEVVSVFERLRGVAAGADRSG